MVMAASAALALHAMEADAAAPEGLPLESDWPGVFAPADEIVQYAVFHELPEDVDEKRIEAQLTEEIRRRPAAFVDALLNVFPSEATLIDALEQEDMFYLRGVLDQLGSFVTGSSRVLPEDHAVLLLSGAVHRAADLEVRFDALAHAARAERAAEGKPAVDARRLRWVERSFGNTRIRALAAAKRLGIEDELDPWCPLPLDDAVDNAALDTERARLDRRNAVVRRYEDADWECPLTLEEFFVGNTEDDSMAPNLPDDEHPGIEVFRDVLFGVRAKDRVADVRVGVHEWPNPGVEADDDIWIAAGPVHVWARGVDVEEVRGWLEPLRPDWVTEVGAGPPCRPSPGEGLRVFRVVWD